MRLQYLQKFVDLGLEVFPMHTIKNGVCTCYLKGDCQNPGKHPFGGKGFKGKAIKSREELAKVPPSMLGKNWGALTGGKSGLVVIDQDPRNGSNETFSSLPQEIQKAILSGLLVRSGGGGTHHYFIVPNRIIKKDDICGIDILGENFQVTLPGSLHISGKEYEADWILDEGTKIPIMPEMLVNFIESLTKEKKSPTTKVNGIIKEGSRNQSLFSIACKLGSQGFDTGSISSMINALNREQCTPPLSDGEVDSIVKSASSYIAGEIQPPKFDLKYLIGPIGDAIKKISAFTEASVVAMYVQGLTLFGGVVGRHVGFKIGGTNHFGHEFVLIVGKSSKSRKGTSLNDAKYLFNQFFEESLKRMTSTGLSSGEGLINRVREITPEDNEEKGKKKKKSNKTYNDSRLIVEEPEFASVLTVITREKNTLSAIIRNAWDGSPLETLTKGAPMRAVGHHISIIGHITVKELMMMLSKDTSTVFNGFMNRFLFIYAEKEKEICLPDDFSQRIDLEKEINSLKKIFSDFNESDQFEWIKFSADAKLLYENEYPRLTAESDREYESLVSRGEVHVIRLALLIAFQDGYTEIQLNHLEAALHLWDYSEKTVAFLYSRKERTLGSPESNKEMKVLDALSSKTEGLTRTDIMKQVFGRNLSADAIDKVRNSLLAAGKIFIKQDESAEVWVLASGQGGQV